MKEIYEQLLQSEDSNTQENCIKTLLEATRKGNEDAAQYMKMVLESKEEASGFYLNECLSLMKPEDKEWLKANRSR